MNPFSEPEYLNRLKNTKARMARERIEILLVTDPGNMNYLSGYDGWSFYVHQLLVVAVDHEEPIWIGRAQDVAGAKVTMFVDPKHILGYQDDYVQSKEKHPYDFVSDFLRERRWDKRVVGVEADNYYFTAACLETLKRNFPNGRFKDATSLVNWVRVVKSSREIQYMREAAQIMDQVMQTAIDGVVPGTRQCDLVGEILRMQTRGTPRHGGDYASIVPLLPTGASMNAPHLTWSDEKFISGQGTVLELAAVRHRYHCPMARTVFLGKPPQKIVDTAKILVDGLNAALDAAKPGLTAEEVEGAWRKSIAKSGIKKESRIGYSTGIGYPPDWGEHTISLRPGDKTALEPNMTIHCIPSIWMDDFGIETSECFRVTETGAEPFCTVPRQLFVKP